NKLMAFDTTAAGLKAILEHSVAAGANQGRFAQIGGLRYSYDPDLAVGSRVQNIALIDKDGRVIAHVLENGVVPAGAPTKITVSTTSFTANGGDGYPIKANGENFRFLLTDGTQSAPVDEAQDFTLPANTPANALGEQAAFEQYMATFHGTVDQAFDVADTPEALDTRIQNVNVRSDTVFEDVGGPVTGGDGNDTITGTAGDDDLQAGAGDDAVSGGPGADTIDLGAGADTLSDTLADLNGDVVAGFGAADTLDILGSNIGRDRIDIMQSENTTTVHVEETTFQLTGDFADGDFMAVARGSGADAHTLMTFEPFLPDLQETVGVDPASINGVTNEAFLIGDGATRFTAEFKSAVTGFHNTLGYYKVAADGTIGDVHLLYADVLDVAEAERTVDLGTPADGEKVAFFLIQDGFTTYGGLPDDLSFVTSGTTTAADVDIGVAPVLRSATLGNLTGVPVFHSIATLNPDDASQVLTGVTKGGRELQMAFEDGPTASADNDFQDIIFNISVQDNLLG
ncbi:MAG: 5'-nucleotidase C-terminal domain-containing protein, partial [Solimonas sp.]